MNFARMRRAAVRHYQITHSKRTPSPEVMFRALIKAGMVRIDRRKGQAARHRLAVIPVLEITFGRGDIFVGLTERDGQFGVALTSADPAGVVGQPASEVPEDQPGIVLWFPTEERARAARVALSAPQ